MIAPSKNPEKESKQFSILALVFGVSSLLMWFLGLVGSAFGVRGAILSKRVNNTKHLTFSIVGMVLSLISIIYYYSVRWNRNQYEDGASRH